MKHEMKRLISFVALLVMMVSMISVCVFPATAAATSDTEYNTLVVKAKVVNPQWGSENEGGFVSYSWLGGRYSRKELYNETKHFSSVEDALAQCKKEGVKNPVILLCAGEYTENMVLNTGATLLGPNAGIDAVDPASKTADKSQAWQKNSARANEAVIKANILIDVAAANGNFTFDGIAFAEGGAIVDRERTTGTTEMVFKNLVFENAGNRDFEGGRGYAINLFNSEVSDVTGVLDRVVRMENIYVTEQNLANLYMHRTTFEIQDAKNSDNYLVSPDSGFISSYFTELYADNIAYVDCTTGFLPRTFYEKTAEPIIEITNSCFHNSSEIATGYVISMDNLAYLFTYDTDRDDDVDDDKLITNASDRASASLKVQNNIFYNASNPERGVLHFELINKGTVVDIQDNYVYSSTPTSVLDAEYWLDSSALDQSSCIVIKNNQLIGAYKVPSMQGVNPRHNTPNIANDDNKVYSYANEATHINMSYNYFGDTAGNCIYNPVYVNDEYARLIRTAFWVDEKMTVSSSDWDLSITDWQLSSVDVVHYTGSATLYNVNNSSDYPIGFKAAGAKSSVKLYLNAALNRAVAGNKITDSLFSGNTLTVYAQVTNSDYPNFKPVYTITLTKSGSLLNIPDFSSDYSKEYFMYYPAADSITVGTVIPYNWQGKTYKMTVGKNVFGSITKLMAYAKNNGVAVPTILVPAGTYTEELVLTDSCVVLGELHGVNPNKKPYETIGQDELLSSAWALDERWADSANVTTFNACIRVAASADDFIITIDGIKMGKGASFVDDSNRQLDNVLIFKNIYMDNAGGGVTTQAGADNTYLFEFSKTTVGKDVLNVYLYDCRIDNTRDYNVFGPYIERLEIDGLYMGAISNKNLFIESLESRNAKDPCVSITNSYFDHCAYGQMGYSLITLNESNNIGSKSNIVYNFDNNVFNDAFPAGAVALDVYFTGNNMKFYFTNNILYDADNENVIFGEYNRFVGNCGSEDCSDMIVFKGNRLIKWNTLPLTIGTGNGTMFDFSGNYFADSLNDKMGLAPAAANVDVRTGSTVHDAATVETYTRRRMDYTYLNWDLTLRSDSTAANDVAINFTSGMYGTGTVATENILGINTTGKVFRDQNVPADCAVYAMPFTTSEHAIVNVYNNAACTEEYLVDELNLTSARNVFYVKATSIDGSKSEIAAIVIDRQLNSECKVLAFGDFLVDQTAKTITGHVNGRYVFLPSNITVSNGATVELYEENQWQLSTSDFFRLSASNPTVVKYVKVTSEDQSQNAFYKLVLNYAANESNVAVAGVSAVDGMIRTETGFKMSISPAASTFSFKPIAYMGSDVKVYNGTELITPDENGVYTVKNGGNYNQTLRLTATKGSVSMNYLLDIVKVASGECELISIDQAVKTDAGFALNFYLAEAVEVDATVSAGATYQVYADYTCTTAYANNVVTLTDASKSIAYIKVTAENGRASKVYKVTLLAQPANRNATPVVTGTIGNAVYTAYLTGEKEFTLYLPAGATSVTLSAKYDLKDASAQTSLYVDPSHAIALDAALTLNTKVTKAYLTNRAGTYTLTRTIAASSEGAKEVAVSALIGTGEWTINIISDRNVVTYSDAPYIADWVQPYVEYLNNGRYRIFEGDDYGRFNCDNNITRNEITAVATRVMGLDVSKYSSVELKFDDTVADWIQPYLKAAVATSLINGDLDGYTGKVYFRGDDNATREQVIKILVAIMMNQDGIDAAAAYYTANKNELDQYYNVYSFADEKEISEWAVPYIHLAVAKYNLVNGSLIDGKYYLKPQQNITRAEVAKIAACMMGY